MKTFVFFEKSVCKLINCETWCVFPLDKSMNNLSKERREKKTREEKTKVKKAKRKRTYPKVVLSMSFKVVLSWRRLAWFLLVSKAYQMHLPNYLQSGSRDFRELRMWSSWLGLGSIVQLRKTNLRCSLQ